MPKWLIEGADLKSGKDRRLSIRAATLEEAERIARKHGVLVSNSTVLEPDPPTPAAEQAPQAMISTGRSTSMMPEPRPVAFAETVITDDSHRHIEPANISSLPSVAAAQFHPEPSVDPVDLPNDDPFSDTMAEPLTTTAEPVADSTAGHNYESSSEPARDSDFAPAPVENELQATIPEITLDNDQDTTTISSPDPAAEISLQAEVEQQAESQTLDVPSDEPPAASAPPGESRHEPSTDEPDAFSQAELSPAGIPSPAEEQVTINSRSVDDDPARMNGLIDPTTIPVARMARPESMLSQQEVPAYNGLYVLGVTMRAVAIFLYVIGLILLVLSAVSTTTETQGAARAFVVLSSGVAAASPLLVGLIVHAFGEGALVLRDLARNSFQK